MKELTKFETLVYFTGATAILLAFFITVLGDGLDNNILCTKEND